MFNDKTQAAHAQGIRELIDRDKNHPSVVMWSIANEPESVEEGAREYFEPLVELARELDPSRPLTYANEYRGTFHNDRLADLFDVICLNRYYGWYVETADLDSAALKLEAELRGWESTFGKPIIITEYGADTLAGLHAVGHAGVERGVPGRAAAHVPRGLRSRRCRHRRAGLELRRLPDLAGIIRVDGNKKGVFTRDRRPKAAAFALRERWLAAGEADTGSGR